MPRRTRTTTAVSPRTCLNIPRSSAGCLTFVWLRPGNFPALIEGWRQQFNNSGMWFGFVQVAGFSYASVINKTIPDGHHSLAAGDLRQAQLSALKLPSVGFSTTVDTGDYTNIHPPVSPLDSCFTITRHRMAITQWLGRRQDKQTPSRRLANQALRQIYGKPIAGAEFPFYAFSNLTSASGSVAVTVAIRAGRAKDKVVLTTDAPLAATQSTSLGAGPSLPRNKCVTAGQFGHGVVGFPQFCGVSCHPFSSYDRSG